MSSSERVRAAFTLVELLVVFGILALLIAMLLPAVQIIRESSRRTHCANNIRQLAIATHNFESAMVRLPIGKIDRQSASSHYGMTWFTQLLPFLDQAPLWETALKDYRHNPSPFGNHIGFQTVLPVVGCPSDPVFGDTHFTRGRYLVACTDYLGVHGTNHLARDGIFIGGIAIRLSEITDGQSNTLLIGERPPSPDFWYGWWYASGGMFDATLGVAEINHLMDEVMQQCPPGPYSFVAGTNQQCDTFHFWSYHSGGANFASADGSVKLIRYTIGDAVMQALATRAGGETASFAQ
jgi:prepilin-type processing-associated H-X9-DG protein